jgi:peptidoglycan/LPS O-acetylase OafA/YrhL
MLPAPTDWGWLSSLTRLWQRGGWIGVDLFFVLSGFLLSGLLFREHMATGRIDPVRFLIRRGFKIYPGFYILIIATAIGVGRLDRPILAELFFVQNYFGGVWGHTWSLAVEEHFYLLLAVSAWLVSRYQRSWRYVPLVYVFVAAGCLAARVSIAGRVATTQPPFDGLIHLAPTHLRIDELLFGVVLSYWWHYAQASRLHAYRWALCVLGVALLVPAFVVEFAEAPWMSHVGVTMLSFGCGALVVGSLLIDPRPARAARWLATIGTYSYSIYLWHFLFEKGAHDYLRAFGWPVYALAYVGGAVTVGMAFGRAIETSALAIRDRLFPSASGRLPVRSDAPDDLSGAGV